ncbi:class I SAM-dependent methyltransferase [Endozoicomonas sp. SESOKO2]|uniref:class I SAM-dependent methyltransferase n=1 Tax=Endozoicomonas sp. SESOKO2 TaxID=2828743 RepID=UPI002147E42C|nr:class I SAM-dependent methyltransferase [Endozoicomonas sp. SESOKO2]
MKKIIAVLLRKAYLLQVVDYILLIKSIFETKNINKQFCSSHPDFVTPPHHLAYDAYNHTNWNAYYNMGIIHSKLISDLVKEYVNEKNIKICEWGCGPARVIRHLSSIEGFDKVGLYGTDYNKNSVEWCKNHINHIKFVKNELSPPLPYESEYFNCAYAISIFTHLSEEKHYAWLSELFRVIKPNGILIFTTHGDLCSRRLTLSEKARYNSGALVVRDKIKEGKKHFTTYHSHLFIKERLLKGHSVLRHITDPKEYNLEQEVWVVRNN